VYCEQNVYNIKITYRDGSVTVVKQTSFR